MVMTAAALTQDILHKSLQTVENFSKRGPLFLPTIASAVVPMLELQPLRTLQAPPVTAAITKKSLRVVNRSFLTEKGSKTNNFQVDVQ